MMLIWIKSLVTRSNNNNNSSSSEPCSIKTTILKTTSGKVSPIGQGRLARRCSNCPTDVPKKRTEPTAVDPFQLLRTEVNLFLSVSPARFCYKKMCQGFEAEHVGSQRFTHGSQRIKTSVLRK